MLGLSLRQEFRGARLKGTAIELSNDANTGATQIGAREFLEITYPTRDLLKAIEAAGPDQGRPIVIIGERGLGKSHLMAALYHAVDDPTSTRGWLNTWAMTLGDPQIGKIALRDGMRVIGESLHRQRYKFLWDVLFDRHPNGNYVRGKWEGMGSQKTDVPSDELIIELLKSGPTMLLLDEFQTWFDGLTNTKQYPYKAWAFNFIQILSEIAKERPDLLGLVLSVRNGETDAYQQVHRVNPVAIDFKAAGSAERIQQDRRRMLLHRIFDNRLQIDAASIQDLVATHVNEYFRLLDIAPSEQDRKRNEFTESWPFAPHLLRLLEEQVLIATDAQETRDMIRILANLFKSRGENMPILTAADFRLDDDASGIGALLDSVSNEHHRTLRSKAQQNIISVMEAVAEQPTVAPHLQDIVGALWLRSIAVGNFAGAEPVTLQADITRQSPIDDNAFQSEMASIIASSFNIHEDGPRLVFREEENPDAKVMACARNDKLFSDGSDLMQLAKTVRYVIGGGDDVAKAFRVIALPKAWSSQPWSALDASERPENWDERLPIIVLPEDPDDIDKRLGRWLKDHVQKRRNTIRFLLPRADAPNLFQDRDLLILARAELKANEWAAQSPEYRRLQTKYHRDLRDLLKKRFDRFALLRRFNFSDTNQSLFSVERLTKDGSDIPQAIEEMVMGDLFVPEDFDELVLQAASENTSVGKLLRELQEPRPSGLECIPWLGETEMKERILRICARGKIAINIRGLEHLQIHAGEDEEAAWKRLRPKLSYTGRQLDEITLMKPSVVPATGGTAPVSPSTGDANGLASTLFAPNYSSMPPSSAGSMATTAESQQPPSATIFANAPDASAVKRRIPCTAPSTSPLNLMGKIEEWGIGPATQLTDVSVRVPAANGAQLKDLLKRLPDGLTFELSLEKEES